MRVTAQTELPYWNLFKDPSLFSQPVEAMPWPVGLIVDINQNLVDGSWSITGRSQHFDQSKIAKALVDRLVGLYGGQVGSVTLALRHKLLAETQGRPVLIGILRQDLVEYLNYLDVNVISVDGSDLANWPLPETRRCATTQELNDFQYGELVPDIVEAKYTGLAIKVTKDGRVTWYRKPNQYTLTVQVMSVTNSVVTFETKVDGIKWFGTLLRENNRMLESVCAEYGDDFVGKQINITFKSVTTYRSGRKPILRVYNGRFERVATPANVAPPKPF